MSSRILPGALLLLFLTPTAAGEEPARPFDPSALRFAPPASFENLAGTYRFSTRLGDSRTLRLELDTGGEKRLVGSLADNPGEVLLVLEPDPEGPGLRGRTRRGFDPCLAQAALVHALPLAPDELVLELGLVYPLAGMPPLPHECPAGPEWMLLPPPGQAGVPVLPESSYRPAPDPGGPMAEVGPGVTGEYTETIDQITRGREGSESQASFERPLGTPRVAGGYRVRITRTVRTEEGETWLHVLVLSPEEGEVYENLDDDLWLDEPEEEAPIPSGYVRPEHVHARLTYTLVPIEEP